MGGSKSKRKPPPKKTNGKLVWCSCRVVGPCCATEIDRFVDRYHKFKCCFSVPLQMHHYTYRVSISGVCQFCSKLQTHLLLHPPWVHARFLKSSLNPSVCQVQRIWCSLVCCANRNVVPPTPPCRTRFSPARSASMRSHAL